uniref:Tf2-1-like SH3-like domain-containing protein n=1 Tax=Nicotiana tabacum TaxID=4097 RepID=A0A1S4AQ85_TOBAC|nr:PREDICTED: uncharacterized protein LOC107800206 [Nicotiana tabacum]
MKGVIGFGKNDKLSHRYSGPFEIIERVGEVPYRLAFLPSLSGIHPVFYLSMIRKYYGASSHVLDFSSVQLENNLTYVEESMAILDMHVRKLRSKNIASVKVQWRGQPVEEAAWETMHDIWSLIPIFLALHWLIAGDGPAAAELRSKVLIVDGLDF